MYLLMLAFQMKDKQTAKYCNMFGGEQQYKEAKFLYFTMDWRCLFGCWQIPTWGAMWRCNYKSIHTGILIYRTDKKAYINNPSCSITSSLFCVFSFLRVRCYQISKSYESGSCHCLTWAQSKDGESDTHPPLQCQMDAPPKRQQHLKRMGFKM